MNTGGGRGFRRAAFVSTTTTPSTVGHHSRPALPRQPAGVKTTQSVGGTAHAVGSGSDGRLWCPTVDGGVVVDTKAARRNPRPPPVFIEQVYAGGRSLDPRVPARLQPTARELRFHYTALSFVAPEKVRFQYKLEGLNRDWVDAESRRVAVFDKVPPGDYRFRVRACNNY